MKRFIAILLAMVMALTLCACGDSKPDAPDAADEPAAPPVLTGEWKQVNSNSDEAWQAATITEDSITINWVTDNGDMRSLYWVGTFVAPTTADEPYSWDSQNDKDQTGSALLASGDDFKTFTYADGQISYEASALGSTMTIRMEKVG